MAVLEAARPVSLVARGAEVEQALHSLRFSGGVMISGESGVGKTALAAAVVERLPTPPVSWVVATVAGRTIPLGALATLLPPDLTGVHPALVAQQVGARLRELAHGSARTSAAPILVVDDAQLLDAQSAAVLLALVTSRSLRVLATLRSGTEPSDAVTALWKEQLLDRLDLSPLGRAATRELLESAIGGPVASGTVEMLWSRSRGNPFYLTELARYGTAYGLLTEQAGVWWWTGGDGVPPRLGELLQRRIDAASPAGLEAVDVLALGEPLPYETLVAVAGEEAVLELDQRQILASEERDGALMLRFAHPLLHSVAERRLSPTRRRALAARLRRAPAERVDLVRRAGWEEAAGTDIDGDLLLRAADALLINDPARAAALAERALVAGGGLRAGLLLSEARSEQGQPDAAAAVLRKVADLASSDDDRFAVLMAEFAIALWGRRHVHQARQVLDRARAVLPRSYRADLLAAEALASLFSSAAAEVVPLAQAVLEEQASPKARIWALTALTAALTFTDRGGEAVAAAQRLLDELSRVRMAATSLGLAHAMVGVTGLFYSASFRLPGSVGRLGRWPGSPAQLAATDVALPAPPPDEQSDLGWPLLVGLRRHFQGDLTGALGPLREAYVQQRSGEGLFRSEATAELVVVLAELGHLAEAQRLLDEQPPDQIAIIPGLEPWARAAVEAAGGHRTRAGELAVQAARLAARRGAAAMALNYLTDAGRWGDPRRALQVLPELGLPLSSDLQQVRAADIAARPSGSAERLLAAAEVQLAAGFTRHALELAELARAADSKGQLQRRITAVHRQAEDRLGSAGASAATPAAGPLTRRESEVSRLAANSLTDKQIADELVLSVRTVQSHLASAYRKLGIRSRSELAGRA